MALAVAGCEAFRALLNFSDLRIVFSGLPRVTAAVHLIPARKRQMYSRNIPSYDCRLNLKIQMINSRGKVSGYVEFVPVAE